ncbi:hypothetical protein PQR66_18970 [Paraburkholderia agricolaris]|uniref:Type I restriction enzyme, R subunit n=1 Tax=Paraburkholderia agricolaris TaxID=2152888 RepID=A0ABW8ZPY9_9BURK
MSQSPEKSGVEIPAIKSLVKLGYAYLPGHTVEVEHRHLAPVLDNILRPKTTNPEPMAGQRPGQYRRSPD